MERVGLANPKDAEQIVRFDHIARMDPRRVHVIHRSIAHNQCYVYELDGAVVAYGVLQYSFYENGFVSMLYVHSEHRRKGIGVALMRHMESLCQTEKLFTSTNQSNLPMQNLLKKLGYQHSGYIENLDEGDPELVYLRRLGA